MTSREAQTHTTDAGLRTRLLVTLGLCAVSLDTTVNVALPALTQALTAPLSQLQWIIIAYVLTTTSLVVGCGRLADLVGRRRVWIGGAWALAAALVGCGIAPSLGWLVAARMVQAVGAALLLASGAALVTATTPPARRGQALGLLATGASVGAAVGPLLGGLLVALGGAQAVFWGRAPLVAAVALLSVLLLPADRTARRVEPFDLLGSALLAGTTVATLLTANRATAHGWLTPPTVALAGAALMLGAGFGLRQRHASAPLVPSALMRAPQFLLGNLTGFLSSAAMFGVWLLLPYYLVDGRGTSALRTGLTLACVPASSALAALPSGWLSDRVPARRLLVVGLILETVALLLISRWSLETSAPVLLLTLLLLGVGLGIFQSPNQSVILGASPPAALGVASGVLAMARTLGIVTGTTILGAVYSARSPATETFSISAYRAAFSVAAVLAVLAVVSALRSRAPDMRQ